MVDDTESQHRGNGNYHGGPGISQETSGVWSLTIDQLRRRKWQIGREQYGPHFLGDPAEELLYEIADGLNYIDQMQRENYSRESCDWLRVLLRDADRLLRAMREV